MGNNSNRDAFKKRKNHDRTVHLTVYVKDQLTGLTYTTKCNKTSIRANRSSEIDKVTCEKCLKLVLGENYEPKN